MSIRIFFILGISICLAGLSCEKDAHIQMHQTDQSLVVEGTIENGKAPKVVLTHSLNYFSSIDATILQGLFVHDAQINVSTPYQEVQLIEKEVDTLLGAKYYYYEPSNPNTFRGKIGRTYTLQIKIKGQTLKATTTIPGRRRRRHRGQDVTDRDRGANRQKSLSSQGSTNTTQEPPGPRKTRCREPAMSDPGIRVDFARR